MSEDKKSEAAPLPLVKNVDRAQMWFRSVEVDRLLEADHPARLLWETIGGLDLSGYYEGIKSNEAQGGRPATRTSGYGVGQDQMDSLSRTGRSIGRVRNKESAVSARYSWHPAGQQERNARRLGT